ncbi:MAG: N-acetylmuramoyl-L-alanine amidase, partial [Elusimicrobiaceae bacterium]|nr:N-acetylmuramoyl-L-alanine amidase [Elusimicrobiaceae bacterium]
VISDGSPVLKGPRKMRIVIDPGHGGKDPGAVRRGSNREKAINLAVAKHLYDYLKKQDFEVKMTRTDDTFVTLAGRSKMANEYKADLFVSVHTNAAKRSAANGFEVYFRSDKATDTEAAEVAAFENEALQYEETHYNFVDMLLQSLAKNEYMNESSKVAGHVRNYVYKEPGIGIAVRQNNSIRQANFYVLKGVQAPAILVEMGYISSPKDRARLNNKSAQKRMALGIGKGIVSYAKAEGWIKK